MLQWFLRFLRRYAIFSASVIATAQGWAWLYGVDEEAKAWIVENRGLVTIVLVLSLIVYGMYDWLEESE